MAFVFTLSLHVLMYNLVFFLKKEMVGFFLRYLYLVFFGVLMILSAIGKSNWQEIPKLYMVYDVVLNNIGTLENYFSYPKIVLCSICLILILIILRVIIKNEDFKLERTSLFILFLLTVGSYHFVGWRNRISCNTSSRELLAEDPIIGPFVKKKNYGVNLSNTYIDESEMFKNWVLTKDTPNVVIINFDALRSDAFGKCINGHTISPTFDSLLRSNTTYKATSHVSSSSSPFNGILSTLYGNNTEHLPINKMGIHHILWQYGYHTNFILGGSHNHFMDLKKHYGKLDNYFETTMINQYFPEEREDDDNGIIKYLRKFQHTSKFKKQFYYFHIMAPHIGAYRANAPLFKVIDKAVELTEKEKSYFQGVNKADEILRELLNYFYKEENNIVLFISSDHGEGLGYHKFLPIIGHNQQLTNETTCIPLIILDSGKRKYFEHKYSTQIDLVPTIIERCFDQHNLPETYYPGISLFKKPMESRFSYHSFYVTKYQDFNFAIIKDSSGHAVEKYLYNPENGQEYIFRLNSNNQENDTIMDQGKLLSYRKLKFEFLNLK